MTWEQMTWEQITLAISAVLAIVGLFRSLEQRKDQAFAELSAQLGSEAPVMRAFAASQLPLFFTYRQFLRFRRPYQDRVVHLALSALKKKDEEKYVRQALFDALVTITKGERLSEIMTTLRPHLYGPERRGPGLLREPDLIGCHLDKVIMHGFVFDGLDLTESSLRAGCNLEEASFRGARMYKARLDNSNLKGADLSDAMIWTASFRGADLKESILDTSKVDSKTSFEGANVRGAKVSQEAWKLLDSDQQESLKGVLTPPGTITT